MISRASSDRMLQCLIGTDASMSEFLNARLRRWVRDRWVCIAHLVCENVCVRRES